MIKIAPSILAADPLNLERDTALAVSAGSDWIHVDVMDAAFVPNLAYTPATVRALHGRFNVPLDVHLMMADPGRYLDAFLSAGADILTIHAEIADDPVPLLRRIRAAGRLAGLAVKPGTPVEAFSDLLPETDLLLTMTVEPGFGGQKLNPDVIPKIRALRDLGYTGYIEADGGINAENLPSLVDAGLTVAVMGTAVFRDPDPAALLTKLHALSPEADQ